MNSLDSFQRFCASRVESELQRCLPAAEIAPTRLHEAMRYATLGSGKRVRAMLSYAAGQALGAPNRYLDKAAAAVELIHAYSLIHDDLPAMDDDNLRRGKPACHREFDEATAILAGDALQALAFHLLSEGNGFDLDVAARIQMTACLSQAAGSRGMAGGQSLDLDAVGQAIDLVALENMHIHKTGALIRAAVTLGARCAADPDAQQVEHLDRYAKCLGLAFQVQDDILDVTGEPHRLGKTGGKDLAQAKPTYVSLLGLPQARLKGQDLCNEALHNLAGFDSSADPLRWIASYVIERDH